jgi:Na+/proline symporter
MLAGIFAAAMSSLSSSINSLSASTVLDILRLQDRDMTEKRRMKISRVVTVIWSAALVLVATLIHDSTSPLIELGLGITSLLYGGILGIFIQARYMKNFSDRAALTGVFVSIAGVVAISKYLAVFWPWYVPLGLLISLSAGFAVNYFIKDKPVQK